MTITEKTIKELERCLEVFKEYERDPGSWYISNTHAAAKRASLDLARILVEWRKTPKPMGVAGNKPK